MKNLKSIILIALIGIIGIFSPKANACTGIKLTSQDGSHILARTMEWGTFVMDSRIVIVPRGHVEYAITPTGRNGLKMEAKYGYVGIGVLDDNLIAEGINEKGLTVELFYFPGYGSYNSYDKNKNSSTVTDAQLLGWILGNFSNIDEMQTALRHINVIGYGRGFEAAHFSVADATGREVVLEYIDGKLNIHENVVGVITNSPSFDWQVTNLNNYINCFAGTANAREINPNLTIKSFGVGSSAFGLPGDLTPPSRFVRAAFYVHTARQQETGHGTVLQAFQILNNFDIPVGAEFADPNIKPNMLSASQWTTATDMTNLKFYYRTEWNYTIRCIDLKEINFEKVKYQTIPLDKSTETPVEYIKIK